jgi:hypothetical protein|tara:strand:- start:583 stop:825 length:243 start_codon:yes stop_codon:yes gene_type:complete
VYNIKITSNTINKTYKDIKTLEEAYNQVIDVFRMFRLDNNNTFNIVLYDKVGKIMRLTHKHIVSKQSIYLKDIYQATYKA